MKYEIMLGILFNLLSKKQVSAKYLAEKYEVSQRTIYRYINSIEAAGVPIYTTQGNGGGISIIDTYRLSSTFMTVNEFEKVISAISAICNEVPDKVLESAIDKLKSTVKNEYSGFNIKSGSLIIDGGPWGDAIGYKSKLITIQKSLESNSVLNIKYHDRNGEVTTRDIDPYFIVFKQGLWYVYAYCHLRNEFRFFKTGRIESANVKNETFIKKEINGKNLPFDKWYLDVETIDVVMEIDKKTLSDAEEWLGIENISNENGKNIARVKLPFDNGLVSKIISYGAGIKVIAPDILKEKIKDSVNQIIKNYE